MEFVKFLFLVMLVNVANAPEGSLSRVPVRNSPANESMRGGVLVWIGIGALISEGYSWLKNHKRSDANNHGIVNDPGSQISTQTVTNYLTCCPEEKGYYSQLSKIVNDSTVFPLQKKAELYERIANIPSLSLEKMRCMEGSIKAWEEHYSQLNVASKRTETWRPDCA